MVRAGAGDADGMREHLERAAAIATESGRASARCETLARLAIEAARLVTASARDGAPDSELLELVERSAAQVKTLLPLLPGHAPWGAQADAALSAVALARGDGRPRSWRLALPSGRSRPAFTRTSAWRSSSLQPGPCLRAGPPRCRASSAVTSSRPLSRIAQSTADEKVRVAWLTGPVGREVVELAGPMETPAPAVDAAEPAGSDNAPGLDAADRRLLQLLTEGRTNAEIAADLDLHEGEVAQRLARLQAPIGRLDPCRGDLAGVPWARRGRRPLMAVRARVDRHKCIGAGNCITLAPTAFDWLAGDYGKADVVGPDSVDEELLRAAAFSCPTAAIILEDAAELLPWQLRGKAGPAQRVLKTFMFTDIVGSTNLVEALGDEAWGSMLAWHNATLREVFVAHRGEEISTTGDGFFVSFDSPDLAVAAAIAIQRRLAEHRSMHGFAPQVRIGLHASDATQVAGDFHGKGVHEAARIAALGGAGEIVASAATVGELHRTSGLRSATLKGISEPIEIVNIEWR